MVRLKYTLAILGFSLLNSLLFAQQTIMVGPFEKVIVSPYIRITFVEGAEEKVFIEKCAVDPSKLTVETNGQTLRIYLEGAKETPKWNTNTGKRYDDSNPMYFGTVVEATITYKNLKEVSLRGDEEQVFKGMLRTNDFRLKVYGNSEVVFEAVDMDQFRATLYGDNSLLVKAGNIASQQYTVYGVSTVDSRNIKSNTGKLTTYGEANYYVHASDEIKSTLFGEATLYYKGNPVVSKGMNFGDMRMSRLD
jgi:hypothetical protein